MGFESRILLTMKVLATLAAICLLPVIALGQVKKSGPWEMQSSGTTASLRGIHAVGGGVAWASGTNGTVLRTEDSGYMWQSCAMPPGAEKLDFRVIWAFDANTAIVMSSGPGDQSRLYKTTDGCSHWTLLYTNTDKDGFWDAMCFAERPLGIYIIGDPVHGHFVLLESDEHELIQDMSIKGFRPLTGESLFAASNSNFDPDEINGFYFATGGISGSWFLYETEDVYHDARITWHRVSIPIGEKSSSSGVFSIQLRSDPTEDRDQWDRIHGVAVGGDYTKPNESTGTAAWTADGGQHWTAATKPPHGYRSTVAWDADAKAWIAAGTNGSDISYDDGKTWQPLDDGNWNALSLPWIVGPKGRIAKLGALPSRK